MLPDAYNYINVNSLTFWNDPCSVPGVSLAQLIIITLVNVIYKGVDISIVTTRL